MFSHLRANNQLFILHKENTPYLEIGNVTNVSAPMPTLGVYGQPANFTVDVTVKVGEQTYTYSKLPSNAEVADWGGNGNLVLTASREAMNSELQSMRQKSLDVINSKAYHEGLIGTIDKMLYQINPEFAEKAAQQEEMATLKTQVGSLTKSVKELMDVNRELMEQLKGDRTGRSKKD